MRFHFSVFIFVLASIHVYAQQNSYAPTGFCHMSQRLANKFSFGAINNQKPTPSPENKNAEQAVDTWQKIGSSQNIYSMLVSQNRPLKLKNLYGTALITFSHIKSTSYIAAPYNNSGAVVVKTSTNGTIWDTSCIWSNNSFYAHSAEGIVYSPTVNLSIDNCYFTGGGILKSGVNVNGSWMASKKMDVANYNAIASQTPGAQQFFPDSPPYTNGICKFDYPRSFSSTDDGVIRALAGRYDGYSNGKPTNYVGAAILKGSFNAGVFSWSSDTLVPNTIIRTNGSKQLYDKAVMAWNNTGNIGYVVFIGANGSYSDTPNSSNKGWQPIVYKTANSGNTWMKLVPIDFDSPANSRIVSHLDPPSNSTVAVPFFNVNEGFDAVVDHLSRLHIVSTICSTKSRHNDSLDFVYQYGTEGYCWSHTAGKQPYIYDFYGDGTAAWQYKNIDSMSTEAPGSHSLEAGYNFNPWNPDTNNENRKVVSDARIQLSRSFGGSGVMYTWSESDTMFINGQKAWNSIPNVKARLYSVSTNSLSKKMNVTRPQTGINSNIANKATFHSVSDRFYPTGCDHVINFPIFLPFSVSNNPGFDSGSENYHWYSSTNINFGLYILECPPLPSVKENSRPGDSAIFLFPNPAQRQLFVQTKSMVNETSIHIINTMGEVVYEEINGTGSSQFQIHLPELVPGIYLVKIKSGNYEATKKLLIR